MFRFIIHFNKMTPERTGIQNPSESVQPPALYNTFLPVFEQLQHSTKQPATKEAYARGWLQALRFLSENGIKTASQIDTETVTTYLDQFKSKPRTFSLKRSTFKALLDWAIDNGLIEENSVALPPSVKTKVEFLPHLTSQQTTRLLSESRGDPRDHLLILLGLKTGAKASELLGLKPKDIIKTKEGKTAVTFNNEGLKPRQVTLDEETANTVDEYLSGYPHNETLFTSHSNRKRGDLREDLRRVSFNYILTAHGQAIDAGLNPTMLRNTFVMNFLGNSQELSETLGITLAAAKKLLSRRRFTIDRHQLIRLMKLKHPKFRYHSF